MDKKTLPDLPREPAIAKLVAHLNGPVATAKAIGDDFPYQRVQEWLARGWASPHYFNLIAPLLPKGIAVDDLYADKVIAKQVA